MTDILQNDTQYYNHNSPTLTASLEYARRGWPVVPLHSPTGNFDQPCSCRRATCLQVGKHPCHKNTCKDQGKHQCHQTICESVGKHPRLMEWEKKATADEATVREWLKMWPASNVGIATGPDFGWVLDVDPRHSGLETLAALEAKHGKLPETLTGDTGGDGVHYVFEYPDFEIKNLTKGEIGPGLDVKAAGGQIVAPPSLHSSGKRYRWRNDAPIVKAPDWLLDLLREAMSRKQPASGPASEVGDKLQHPNRYPTLFSLAGSMRRRGMTVDEIKVAVAAVNENRCDPPLDADTVRKIAEGIGKYSPADSPPEPELSLPGWMDVEPSEPAKPKQTKSDDPAAFGPGFYTSLRELHAKETVPADDLMIGVRRRQVTIFASVTNVGKTTVMLNHALAAAGGQMWLPLLPDAPERPLKIVFIDAESTDDELKKDTQTMLRSIGNKEIAIENFIPVVDATIDDEALNLSNKKHFDQVKRFLKYHQPDIAIFDTISALFTLYSENDNAEVVRKVIRPLKELAVAGNCAIWASHHIGKAGESDDAEKAYRGRGASSFGANVRGVINLTKEKTRGDGYVKLELGKSKGNQFEPVILKLDSAKRTFDLLAEAPKVETPYQQVIGVFNGHPLKRAEVLEKLPKFKPATVDRYLKQAVGSGELIKSEGGLYEKPQNPTPYRDDKNGVFAQTSEDEELNPDLLDWGENSDGGVEEGDLGGDDGPEVVSI